MLKILSSIITTITLQCLYSIWDLSHTQITAIIIKAQCKFPTLKLIFKCRWCSKFSTNLKVFSKCKVKLIRLIKRFCNKLWQKWSLSPILLWWLNRFLQTNSHLKNNSLLKQRRLKDLIIFLEITFQESTIRLLIKVSHKLALLTLKRVCQELLIKYL